jgi:hypothetical protein
MKAKVQTSVFAFIFLLLSQLTFAQGNQPCNTSQPRPIRGNQHPCPGTIETYCIDNDRNYTSFEWDVPRAQAGNPPTGWEIISGQGTSCVTVRVGTKSGTMKVKVNDPICGTKVATLPVKPSHGFIVDVMGPDSVCYNVNQTYKADVADSLGHGNGHGNTKGDFSYNWTVPAGWTIVSGQGTQQIVVTPGANDGKVTVTATFTGKNGGNGNNGNGVGGYKGYCNTTATDAIDVDVNNNCGTPPTCSIAANIAGPDTVCAFNDDPYTFTTPAQAGATYVWTVPADWFIDAGDGTNSITVFVGFEPGNVTVTVTNACGTATDSNYVNVNEECGNITPLPVELTSFKGSATAEGIALNWSTATEKDNDRFEVQRSRDGRSFETVGTVKGNGNASTLHNYSFQDKSAAKGVNYYRLRQVDYSGTSEMSRMIKVSAEGKASSGLVLYPNPSTDGVFNVRTAQPIEVATLQIMDMSGRVLHTKEVRNTNEISLDGKAYGMKPGIYLVSLKAGTEAMVQKLIIK